MNLVLNDTWQATQVCFANDQEAETVLHYRVSATGGAPVTDSDLASRLDALLAPVIKPLMGAGARYSNCRVQRINPLPVTLPVFDSTSAGAGTATGDLLPRQDSGIISKVTQFAGRKFRGRCYVPFPTEDQNDANGLPTNAYVALLDAWAAKALTTFTVTVGGNTATMTPVLWHRATRTSDDLVTHFSRQRWATQRRRGSFGRTNL